MYTLYDIGCDVTFVECKGTHFHYRVLESCIQKLRQHDNKSSLNLYIKIIIYVKHNKLKPIAKCIMCMINNYQIDSYSYL